MQARIEDLLPVDYFHVVFTLPSQVADMAYQNKAAVYGLLFKASAQTLPTIAAAPEHLDAKIGMTRVLHRWGAALTHHPQVHVIVPEGGPGVGSLPMAQDGSPVAFGFFLPVKILSKLFRRLVPEGLIRLQKAGKLKVFGDLAEFG